MQLPEITPADALTLREEHPTTVFLDVRTLGEWIGAHIPGAIHVPLHELTQRVHELDAAATTVVVCAHGIRSAHAGIWLLSEGFSRVLNLRHGMAGWAQVGGPMVTGLA